MLPVICCLSESVSSQSEDPVLRPGSPHFSQFSLCFGFQKGAHCDDSHSQTHKFPTIYSVIFPIRTSNFQITTHFIKALSSHMRSHDFDMYRPMNILQFTGSFSIAEAHAWLHHLLPNVPSKCPPADTITNNYQCATNGGTQLQVVYSKGSAIFKSDCMTTIYVIREKVSEQTMKMQIRVEVSCGKELNTLYQSALCSRAKKFISPIALPPETRNSAETLL